MKPTINKKRSIQKRVLGSLMLALAVPAAANEINLAEKAQVKVSSEADRYPAKHVNDGVVSDVSRWMPDSEDSRPWVELSFPEPITVGMIDLFSGYGPKDTSALKDFDVAVHTNGSWQTPRQWEIRDNKKSSLRVYIDRKKVTKIRLAPRDPVIGRIREIAVYDNKEAQGLKDVGGGSSDAAAHIDFQQHQIAANQIGYFTERPKRFTAPLSGDGLEFTIHHHGESEVLFQGVLKQGIGDFSEFKPADTDKHYEIRIEGGDLKAGVSDPFLIRKDLDKEQYWQAAVDFLNDTRSVVGTHPSAYGGTAWRDGTFYDAIVPSLVKFYLADEAFVDAMPRQIDWQDEKRRVTSSSFKFDSRNPGSDGVMDAVHDYYDLAPPKADAPDVVKLIHWGAGYILMKPKSVDPSSKDKKSRIHSQTVEQLSYVLWAWPKLEKWLPKSFYDQCHEFCFSNWDPSLEVNPLWHPKTYAPMSNWKAENMHPLKGRYAPGHSIVPNLLMHEVALREGRSDADKYLKAAVEQAEYLIENLDWQDGRASKGHRLSEHRTIPNLVWLLQKYPEQAPSGLKEKIVDWAEVAVSRSDNFWDFRRMDDEMWTIPGMNEVGNSIGLPAICLSASWVVDDPQLKERLIELAFASVDHLFGRNPMMAGAPSHPNQGFPEVERGWPKLYKENVCARLEGVRGNIASLPGSEMYPFKPGVKFRHPEGWCNYGAGWCISLSYMLYDTEQTAPDL